MFFIVIFFILFFHYFFCGCHFLYYEMACYHLLKLVSTATEFYWNIFINLDFIAEWPISTFKNRLGKFEQMQNTFTFLLELNKMAFYTWRGVLKMEYKLFQNRIALYIGDTKRVHITWVSSVLFSVICFYVFYSKWKYHCFTGIKNSYVLLRTQ